MDVEIPLPRFRQPPGLDPDLPEVDPPASSPQPATPDSDPPSSPSTDDRPGSPLPSLEPPAATRTRTSATGDPVAAGKVIGGILVIAAGIAAALLARSGRSLRQPTRRQVADVGDPLGRILARHIPAEFIGRDLADATEAAAAVHAYVLDEQSGPLVARIATAVPYPDSEN